MLIQNSLCSFVRVPLFGAWVSWVWGAALPGGVGVGSFFFQGWPGLLICNSWIWWLEVLHFGGGSLTYKQTKYLTFSRFCNILQRIQWSSHCYTSPWGEKLTATDWQPNQFSKTILALSRSNQNLIW